MKRHAIYNIKFITLLVCLSLSSTAFGQVENLPVRVGKHAGYTRLVFDWDQTTTWQTRQQGTKVDIIFNRAANLDINDIKKGKPVIQDAMTVTADDKTLHLQLTVPEGATKYDFNVGPHVIVDIYKPGIKPPDQEVTKSQPAPVPAPPTQITKKPAAEPVAKTTKPEAPIAKKETDTKQVAAKKPAPEKQYDTDYQIPKPRPARTVKDPAATAPPIFDRKDKAPLFRIEDMHAAPVTKVEKVELPPQDPEAKTQAAPVTPLHEDTILTVSTLEATGIAVFARAGRLWIVLDKPTAGTDPRKRGPFADKLGAPQAIAGAGATGFIYTLPKGLTAKVSGSNLKWDITLNSWPGENPEKRGLRTAPDESGITETLYADFGTDSQVFKISDPVIGDTLIIGTTQEPGYALNTSRQLVDFELLPAWQGFVIRPKRDGVTVTAVGHTKRLDAPGGLTLTGEIPDMLTADADEEIDDTPVKRIFDLPGWQLDGLENYEETTHRLETEIGAQHSPGGRTRLMLKLAQYHFANNFGPEALGVLQFAAQENPELEKNIDFIALRGAAMALTGRYKDALTDLSIKELQAEPEAGLWRGYAAASAELWREAHDSFPKDMRLLATYPDRLAVPLGLYMAEARLRAGETKKGHGILQALKQNGRVLQPHQQAALDYLTGETLRQEEEYAKALKIWDKVAGGKDRLYHAKAGLAAALLKLQQEDITQDQAIEDLETLRFAWRGDALESQTMHRLGKLYINAEKYNEGFAMLRNAAALKTRTANTRAIAADMTQAFYDLYVGGKADKLSPLKSLAIYNEFSELTPVGPEGDKVIENLAERLIQIDLLDRAAKLLEHQIEYRLGGEDAIRVGTRLAAIQLLDNKPEAAIAALDKSYYLPMSPEVDHERKLMRARALSKLEKPGAALSVIKNIDDAAADNLRVDIYWQDNNWQAAANVLEKLLAAEHGKNTEPEKTLTPREVELIVNLAVALKLTPDTERLYALRNRYAKKIAAGGKGDLFRVITRPPGRDTLTDRETMMEVVTEVDMFKGFLESYNANYRSAAPQDKPAEKTEAPAS